MKKDIQSTKENPNMPFGMKNYVLMGAGVVILIIGFLLMAGGGSDDPNQFSYEIFSTRRIVVAPLVLLFGFALEFYAIIKK